MTALPKKSVAVGLVLVLGLHVHLVLAASSSSGGATFSPPDGDYALRATNDDTRVYLTLTSNINNYMAFGIKQDDSASMAPADNWVVWIETDGTTVQLVDDTLTGYLRGTPQTPSELLFESVEVDGTTVSISFSRLITPENADNYPFIVDNTQNFIWAIGARPTTPGSLAYGQHGSGESFRGGGAINLLTGATVVTEVAVTQPYQAAVCAGIAVIFFLIVFICTLPSAGTSALTLCCLHKRPCPGCNFLCFGALTWGNYASGFLYIASCALFFGLGFYFFTVNSGVNPFASATGVLGCWTLMILMFPIARNSVWEIILRIPYERAIFWHRVFTRAFIGIVAAHAISMLVVRGSIGAVFAFESGLKYSYGAGFGSIAFILYIVINLTSWDYIRRNYFEVFFAFHSILPLCAIVLTILHYHHMIYYYIAPGLLFTIDRIIRSIRSFKTASKAVFTELPGGVTRVDVYLDAPFHKEPGQYAFLRVKAVSWTEWHPISMSSPPGGPTEADPVGATSSNIVTFHIKNMGKHTWSGKVCALNGKTLLNNVSIDGPHGRLTVPLEAVSSVILVAGGVGITPMAACLQHLMKEGIGGAHPVQNVTLAWIGRDESLFQSWFPVMFDKAVKVKGVRVLLYCTNAGQEIFKPPPSGIPIIAKRPNMEEMLREAIGSVDPKDACVYVCGPGPLVVSSRIAANNIGCRYHAETFIF